MTGPPQSESDEYGYPSSAKRLMVGAPLVFAAVFLVDSINSPRGLQWDSAIPMTVCLMSLTLTAALICRTRVIVEADGVAVRRFQTRWFAADEIREVGLRGADSGLLHAVPVLRPTRGRRVSLPISFSGTVVAPVIAGRLGVPYIAQQRRNELGPPADGNRARPSI
jgi:hypothetical protein